MLAITQLEYYTTVLKYGAIVGGGTVAAVLFFLVVWWIVFYGRYLK
tara:strand:+ start:809 stop:946 length:138 start_codon:yes stop_codon:yes gene_type:complete